MWNATMVRLFGLICLTGAAFNHQATAANPATAPATRPAAEPSRPLFALSDSRKVVYVIDTSMWMMQRFMLPRQLVNNQITALGPGQSFGIVHVSSLATPRVLSTALYPADAAHKRAAFEFMDDVTLDKEPSDFSAALRAAYAMKPDVIYLLTAAQSDLRKPYDKVADDVVKFDAGRKIPVHVIGWEVGGAEAGLIKLAKVTGGTYRPTSEKEQDDAEDAKRALESGARK